MKNSLRRYAAVPLMAVLLVSTGCTPANNENVAKPGLVGAMAGAVLGCGAGISFFIVGCIPGAIAGAAVGAPGFVAIKAETNANYNNCRANGGSYEYCRDRAEGRDE